MLSVNSDSKSHSAKRPEKYLQEAEQAKKKMYLEVCLQKRRHFSPFVSYVNGLMGVEATATLKRIASRLTTKWRQPYLRMCAYIRSRIAITMVRATNRCIRGSRVLTHRISVQRPLWEDGTRINIFR